MCLDTPLQKGVRQFAEYAPGLPYIIVLRLVRYLYCLRYASVIPCVYLRLDFRLYRVQRLLGA